MPAHPAQFQVGETVQRTNQPDAVGVVREVRWDEPAESWNYSIQFGAQVKAVPEEGLRAFVLVKGPWESFESGAFSGHEHFAFIFTYHRLRRPPARIAHSFTNSRTLFFPHQFKPLLKFLDHPGKRLLIADDVGLGKTIEAGYILRELQGHRDVDRVLVLVPSRLRSKWKRELSDRFEETFEVMTGKDLLALAERARSGREVDPFRWIVSYESARTDAVRSALEETQPAIDVLIADEAHRMRNPGTLQQKLGSVLCRCADATIFLSATPVQNKLEDLWHLLRLLSPEEFQHFSVFESTMNANRHLIAAQRSLAHTPPSLVAAASELQAFLETTTGGPLRGTEVVRILEESLASETLDRRTVVELQGHLGRISVIGDILSRTRKVDALPNRAVRDAKWQPVTLSASERDIYESVQTLCLASGLAKGSWGSEMALIQAYRVTASCIPAAMGYFAEKLRDAAAIGLRLDRHVEDTSGSEEPMGANESDASDKLLQVKEFRDKLRETVQLWEKGSPVDSKLSALIDLLEGVWREDDAGGQPRRKVVVFSFFRRTLEYLREQLRARDVDVRMIHGLIPPRERDVAIDEFLDRSPLVLLTSEVGGEGLDLQKASVVVNYDLPWNPMVVEQRIGRVDRIGQEAPRIIIRSLVVEASVEQNIVARLLDKIGVFRGSIGELDEIVGEPIKELLGQYLRQELTEAELEARVQQEETAIELRLKAAKEVLGRVDGLLAADQDLVDEINALTGERQIPSEDEMLGFLNAFLARNVPGCQLPSAVVRSALDVDLRGPLPDALSSVTGADGETRSFARRIASAPLFMTLSREAGYRHPRAEVLRLGHPLIRFALEQLQQNFARDGSAASFCLRLRGLEGLQRGDYAFAVSFVEIQAVRPVTRLAVAIVGLGEDGITIESEVALQILLRVLVEGENASPPQGMSGIQLASARDRLQSVLSGVVGEWEAKERRLDALRSDQQESALRSTAELGVSRATARLRTLQERQAAAFAQNMAERRLEKAERDLAEARRERPRAMWQRPEREDVAVGLLRVGDV